MTSLADLNHDSSCRLALLRHVRARVIRNGSLVVAVPMRVHVLPLVVIVLLGRAVEGAQPQIREGPGFTAASSAMRAARSPFVENLGQWPPEALFEGDVGGCWIRIERDAIVVAHSSRGASGRAADAVLRLVFERASKDVVVEGQGERPGTHSYFQGSDASSWVRGALGYERVVFRDLYPGVDVVVRDAAGTLEYDLLVAPGADLAQVVVRYEGADCLQVEADGSLAMETPLGGVVQPSPATWECSRDGERRALRCEYRMIDECRVGFAVEGWSPDAPLVIDPGLEWSTYLGYSGADWVKDVAFHPSGDLILVGRSTSPDFPVTPGAFNPNPSAKGVFVVRFDPDQQALVYAAHLGTGTSASPYAVTIHPDGGAVVVGSANTGLPTTPAAFQPKPADIDAFVLRLSADGTSLVYSTYLGGKGLDIAWDVVVDSLGQATVVGETTSSAFPTTPGSFDTIGGSNSGYSDRDAFVTRFTSDGTALVYSTYLGGSVTVQWPSPPEDVGRGIALDPNGSVTVTGVSRSVDFPVTPGAFDTKADQVDAFVTRLSPDGSALEFSTYLGGRHEERGFAIARDPTGAVTVTGWTNSWDFPITPGAYNPLINLLGIPTSAKDGFVARFDPSGSSLLFSTFLGGYSWEEPRAVAVDSAGVTTVGGFTFSPSFPTTAGALMTSAAELFDVDIFVSRLSAAGDQLYYSTFVGGKDEGTVPQDLGLALDPTLGAAVGSVTAAVDFPITPGAFDPTPSVGDGVVFQLDMLPTGVTKYGQSTPACQGPLAIGVTRMPAAGASGFEVTCTNGPYSAPGVLGIAAAPSTGGIPVGGAVLWIDPGQVLLVIPVTGNSLGYSHTVLALPAGSQGYTFFAQYGFLNGAACPGPDLISTSNALAITVQ